MLPVRNQEYRPALSLQQLTSQLLEEQQLPGRLPPTPAVPLLPPLAVERADGWSCNRCTLLNHSAQIWCEACGGKRLDVAAEDGASSVTATTSTTQSRLAIEESELDADSEDAPPRVGHVLDKLVLFSAIEAKAKETPSLQRRSGEFGWKLQQQQHYHHYHQQHFGGGTTTMLPIDENPLQRTLERITQNQAQLVKSNEYFGRQLSDLGPPNRMASLREGGWPELGPKQQQQPQQQQQQPMPPFLAEASGSSSGSFVPPAKSPTQSEIIKQQERLLEEARKNLTKQQQNVEKLALSEQAATMPRSGRPNNEPSMETETVANSQRSDDPPGEGGQINIKYKSESKPGVPSSVSSYVKHNVQSVSGPASFDFTKTPRSFLASSLASKGREAGGPANAPPRLEILSASITRKFSVPDSAAVRQARLEFFNNNKKEDSRNSPTMTSDFSKVRDFHMASNSLMTSNSHLISNSPKTDSSPIASDSQMTSNSPNTSNSPVTINSTTPMSNNSPNISNTPNNSSTDQQVYSTSQLVPVANSKPLSAEKRLEAAENMTGKHPGKILDQNIAGLQLTKQEDNKLNQSSAPMQPSDQAKMPGKSSTILSEAGKSQVTLAEKAALPHKIKDIENQAAFNSPASTTFKNSQSVVSQSPLELPVKELTPFAVNNPRDEKNSVSSLAANQKSSISSLAANQKSFVSSLASNQKSSVSSQAANQKCSVSSPEAYQKNSVSSPDASQKSSISSLAANQKSSVSSLVANQKSSVSSPVTSQKSYISSLAAIQKSSVPSPAVNQKSSVSSPAANQKSKLSRIPVPVVSEATGTKNVMAEAAGVRTVVAEAAGMEAKVATSPQAPRCPPKKRDLQPEPYYASPVSPPRPVTPPRPISPGRPVLPLKEVKALQRPVTPPRPVSPLQQVLTPPWPTLSRQPVTPPRPSSPTFSSGSSSRESSPPPRPPAAYKAHQPSPSVLQIFSAQSMTEINNALRTLTKPIIRPDLAANDRPVRQRSSLLLNERELTRADWLPQRCYTPLITHPLPYQQRPYSRQSTCSPLRDLDFSDYSLYDPGLEFGGARRSMSRMGSTSLISESNYSAITPEVSRKLSLSVRTEPKFPKDFGFVSSNKKDVMPKPPRRRSKDVVGGYSRPTSRMSNNNNNNSSRDETPVNSPVFRPKECVWRG